MRLQLAFVAATPWVPRLWNLPQPINGQLRKKLKFKFKYKCVKNCSYRCHFHIFFHRFSFSAIVRTDVCICMRKHTHTHTHTHMHADAFYEQHSAKGGKSGSGSSGRGTYLPLRQLLLLSSKWQVHRFNSHSKYPRTPVTLTPPCFPKPSPFPSPLPPQVEAGCLRYAAGSVSCRMEKVVGRKKSTIVVKATVEGTRLQATL